MYTYKYPRPAVTTDAVVWGFDSYSGHAQVLLIRRKNPPFQGHYALPGGFLDENESAEDCVVRELAEETGLTDVPLVQMRTFSQPGRDPRGHTVSVVFFSMIDLRKYSPMAGDDAAHVEWVKLMDILRDRVNNTEGQSDSKQPKLLAFDHYDIIAYSALFVLRNISSGSGFAHEESQLYPFKDLLEKIDISLLKRTCLEFKNDYAKFVGR